MQGSRLLTLFAAFVLLQSLAPSPAAAAPIDYFVGSLDVSETAAGYSINVFNLSDYEGQNGDFESLSLKLYSGDDSARLLVDEFTRGFLTLADQAWFEVYPLTNPPLTLFTLSLTFKGQSLQASVRDCEAFPSIDDIGCLARLDPLDTQRSGSGELLLAAVPEPSTTGLLITALLLPVVRRVTRRRH